MKKKDTAAEEREAQFEIIGDIVGAQEIAKRIFGTAVTAKVVFQVFDNLPLDKDGNVAVGELAEFEEDIKKAKAVVDDHFGSTASNDPEIVLGLFERVFAKVEDEDGAEGEGED